MRNLKLFFIFLAVSASIFYISITYPHYFNFNSMGYGIRYWPVHQLLFTHIMAGLTALIIGALQFLPKKNKKFHRACGYIYLISVNIGSISALVLIKKLDNNPLVSSGLTTLAILWFATSFFALISAKNKNFISHKNWMTRSYILTFAFTNSRLIHSILVDSQIASTVTISIIMTWGGWLIPLLINELSKGIRNREANLRV